MSRMVRIVLALLFTAGVVVLGFQGNAWASRLTPGSQSPVSSGPSQSLLVSGQLQGTAPTATPETSLTSQTGTVGDCAGGIALVKSAPSGVTYRAYVVNWAELPQPLPNVPISCAFKLQVFTSTNLSSDTLVCWPILATPAGSAYYYDGSQWVKALAQTDANQECADYVPGNAPNPVYVVVFSTEPTAQIPVTGGLVPAPFVAGRKMGTVVTTPLQIPVTGQTSAVGTCTWVFSAVESPPAGVKYTVQFVPETDLPTPFPGLLVSCPVKVQAVTSINLGAKTLVCWPLLPERAGFAYYYDGSQWVKTTSTIADNQVCADVVADSAPNPAFVAVFDK